MQFEDRGRHTLKGVPGEWQLLHWWMSVMARTFLGGDPDAQQRVSPDGPRAARSTRR